MEKKPHYNALKMAFATFLVITASGAALADGCRDKRGLLGYCPVSNSEDDTCIDKRGFEVSCGLPGSSRKNSMPHKAERISTSERKSAGETKRRRVVSIQPPVEPETVASRAKRRGEVRTKGEMQSPK